MDNFQYIFEVFALLIGLALAEMLGGFGQVLKLRARRKAAVDPAAIAVRIGWLVPLLGLLVLVDLATFYMIVWNSRAALDMNLANVLGVLVLIGGYYLLSTQVFPDEPQLWPDFDAYYWLQKRLVVWGMLIINVLSQLATSALEGGMTEARADEAARAVSENPMFAVASVMLLLNLPAFLWLAFSKRKRVDIALMVFIIGTQFFVAVTGYGVDLGR